jgi:hypothetical protein
VTKDPGKETQHSAVEHYFFSAAQLYSQLRYLRVPLQPGFTVPTKSVISEDDLQRFLQKYKRFDLPETFEETHSEKEAESPAFLPKTHTKQDSKKLPILLTTVLAILLKFRPESGKKQMASKDTRIIRPPGSTLNSVAEFFFSSRTMERVVTPIISDMQVEYCEALSTHRKIKAFWIRLSGYWSLFKALGLYSVVKMFFEMWRKLSSS